LYFLENLKQFSIIYIMRMMAAGIDPRWRLDTPTDLPDAAVREISAALNAFVADAFALYLKIKNFHWHISGPHFATLPLR